MKERLRQMRQWWDEVLQEEDEGSYSEDNKTKVSFSSSNFCHFGLRLSQLKIHAFICTF